MHTKSVQHWQHNHSFGQEIPRAGERRTLLVIAITTITMIVEIVAGIAYGSMALLADGLHMASHTVALGIAAFAYIYARKHAHDERYSFGTGKVNVLGGFTGAVLLALFATFMAWESVGRLLFPVEILFDRAIVVAVLGLVVNGASLFILGRRQDDESHSHDHGHGHSHSHALGGHGDHNLRAATLHVLADAMTSLFAIFALLAGKYFGLNWLDPVMGIVGAILVARWSWGLLRDTSKVLLDRQAPKRVRDAVKTAVETRDDDRVADLHVWSIGPNMYAAAISLVADNPQNPDHYRSLLPHDVGLVHATIEVHHCRH